MSKLYFVNNPEGVATLWKAISDNFAFRDEIPVIDPYILPVATGDVLGGVKIGSGLTVTQEGLISVDMSPISTSEINSMWSNA